MASGVKTVWTDEMDSFLKDNYTVMTNRKLADALGLTLTITKMRLYHLGLKRMEMEYFTAEQLEYLVNNYQTTGNVRMANYLNEHHPKNKPWTENHIVKKLGYLGLKRTRAEQDKINSFESSPGGLRYTINKNSSSLNLHPSWVANQIAWRNKHLQREILEHHPELVTAKKQQILINRRIKAHGKK